MELDSAFDIDASDEQAVTRVDGLQHKCRPTALLGNDICSSHCRFCFRKRLTLVTSSRDRILPDAANQSDNMETTLDIRKSLDYISSHSETSRATRR